MKRSRSYNRLYFENRFIVSAALILQLILLPSAYILSFNLPTAGGMRHGTDTQPYLQFLERSLFFENIEKEYVPDPEQILLSEKSSRLYIRFLDKSIIAALSYSFCIFGLLAAGSVLINKKWYCKSVLALSMGGHAPPLQLCLEAES